MEQKWWPLRDLIYSMDHVIDDSRNVKGYG